MKPFVLAVALAASTPAVQDFDFIVQKVETNYSGFSTKVTPSIRPPYESLTKKIREQMAQASADDADTLIKTWVDFFKDRHLFVTRAPSKEVLAPPVSGSLIDELALRKSWKNSGKHHPLEGVWESENYRLAVVPQGGTLQGLIISSKLIAWKPGFVKLTLLPGNSKVLYRNADYAVSEGPVKILAHGAGVDFDGAVFQRVFPPLPKGADPDRLVPQDRFFLKKISPHTLFLRLPTFDHTVKPELDKLLADHAEDLAKTDNLLIDLRSNGGGSDITFAELMKYIYTRPIYSIGTELLSTPDNIAKFEQILLDPLYPKEEKPWIQSVVDQLRAAPGKWVIEGGQTFDIQKFPGILPYPKRIGVLISDCGSSAENFVLQARQSRKVTTFGSPSAGVLDFGNIHTLTAPSGLQLTYPTSRSLRLPNEPIDNIGIQPDIPISPEIDDPVTVVQLWLERQSD